MDSPNITPYSIMDMEEEEEEEEEQWDVILGVDTFAIETSLTPRIARPLDAGYKTALSTSETFANEESADVEETVSDGETSSHEECVEPGASQKVFATTELLEMILLELPLTMLFIVQRVSTTFDDTINNSVRLRRKMFLETDHSFEAANKQETNPILSACAFNPKPGLLLELVTKNSNPTFQSLTKDLDYDLPYFTTPTSKNTRTRDKVWLGYVHESTKRFKLPHRTDVRESWQYMFLKQGPPARTSVRLWHKAGKTARALDIAREKFRRRTFMGRVWEFIESMH